MCPRIIDSHLCVKGVAFATIANLPPEYGLYTAMVTPIVAALFGSSLHLVSGPTTAISIVVFAAISHHSQPGTPEFISSALTLTFLAGVYQLAFGLARLVNFVSHTVVIGFTAGAAILIATSQMKHINTYWESRFRRVNHSCTPGTTSLSTQAASTSIYSLSHWSPWYRQSSPSVSREDCQIC